MTLCSSCNAENSTDAATCQACGGSLTPAVTIAATVAAPNVAPHALPPGATLLDGAFSIGRVLAHSGFGITYLGSDTRLHREVAIKEFFPPGCVSDGDAIQPGAAVPPADFASAKRKFREEAEALANFHHPNVRTVYSVFEENNTVYMVMEYLRGKTLREIIEERGALLEPEAVGYIKQIGLALNDMHQVGLVHGDINPDNVIVCDDARVVLIDFGLNRKLEAANSYSTSGLADPAHSSHLAYAPLEQYGAQSRFGAHSDIYAVGSLLYHLLTGKVPVAAPDRAQGESLPPPHRVNPGVNRAVSNAVLWAMELRSERRPQSVRAFLDRLEGHARAMPPVAPSLSRPAAPTPLVPPAPPARTPRPSRLRTTMPSWLQTPPVPEPVPAPAPQSVPQPAPPEPIQTDTPVVTTAMPPRPPRSPKSPVTSQSRSDALRNMWAPAAAAFALLAYFVPEFQLWTGLAAVMCGIIGWAATRRFTFTSLGSILGVGVGAWVVLKMVVPATLPPHRAIPPVSPSAQPTLRATRTLKKVTVRQSWIEPIPYAVKQEKAPDLKLGKWRIKQRGQRGQRKLVAEVTYQGEREVSRHTVSNQIIKEPTSMVLLIGTGKETTPEEEREEPRRSPTRSVRRVRDRDEAQSDEPAAAPSRTTRSSERLRTVRAVRATRTTRRRDKDKDKARLSTTPSRTTRSIRRAKPVRRRSEIKVPAVVESSGGSESEAGLPPP